MNGTHLQGYFGVLAPVKPFSTTSTARQDISVTSEPSRTTFTSAMPVSILIRPSARPASDPLIRFVGRHRRADGSYGLGVEDDLIPGGYGVLEIPEHPAAKLPAPLQEMVAEFPHLRFYSLTKNKVVDRTQWEVRRSLKMD